MIVKDTPLDHVETNSPDSEEIEFSLKSSAKAYSILSKQLYTNSILAIVREICANALDAHTEVKTPDVPISVHLPTQFEPYFTCRDYGPGLSYKNMKLVFCVYFESLKNHSNDGIGGLGLGCKSPFSYTNTFTVTSWHEGIKTVYSAFENDKGVPSIIPLTSSESDEPSGLEIQVPVKLPDINSFITSAQYVYKHYRVKPAVNLSNFVPESATYALRDILPGSHVLSGYPKSYVLMGPIEYPIEIDQLENPGVKSVLRTLGLELEFPIGSLDIQPSRERLRYDPESVDALTDRILAVKRTIIQNIEKELSESANIHDQIEVALKYYESNMKSYLIELTKKDPRWSKLYTLIQNHFWAAFNFGVNNDTNLIGFNYKIDTNGMINKRQPMDKISRQVASSYKFNAPVYYCDVKTDISARLRTLKCSGNVNLLVQKDPNLPVNLEKLKQAWYLTEDIVALSTVKPTKLSRPASKATSENAKVYKLRQEWGGKLTWDEVKFCQVDQINSSSTKYYIPLSGYAIDSKKVTTTDFKAFVKTLVDSEVFQIHYKNIYGVRKNLIKHVEKDTNWVNLLDYLDQIIKDKATELAVHYALLSSECSVFRLLERTVLEQVRGDVVEKIIKCNPNYSNSTESYTRQRSKFTKMMSYLNLSGTSIETEEANIRKEITGIIENMYPMLQMLEGTSYITPSKMAIVKDYIETINRTQGEK